MIGKIQNKKRFIIIICLLTFSFTMFRIESEPKAEILTASSALIVGCVALATACGVVITHPEMVKDVGTRIYEKIKDIDGAIEQIGNKIKFKLTTGVISAILPILMDLPKEDYYKSFTIDLPFNSFSMPSMEVLSSLPAWGEISIGSFSFDSPYTETSTFVMDWLNDYDSKKDYHLKLPVLTGSNTLDFKLVRNNLNSYCELYYSINGSEFFKHNSFILRFTYQTYQELIISKYFSPTVGDYVGTMNSSVCIPYRPSNSESVSNDKVQEFIGSIGNAITVPNKDYQYSPSVDVPISKPQDFGQDVEVTNEQDIDDGIGDDVIDGANTGDSVFDKFGDWLLQGLKILLSPITKLLEMIKDLINSIIETMGGLLDKLLEWLKVLFAPITLLLENIYDFIKGIVEAFNPDFEMPAFPSDILPVFDISKLLDFSRLWNVQPIKPSWKISGFWNGINHNLDSEDVEINIFDIPQIEDNIDIIRNFTTYPLLFIVIWFIIKHFMPKKVYE